MTKSVFYFYFPINQWPLYVKYVKMFTKKRRILSERQE